MKRPALLSALLAASAHAWLPQDRELAAFNRTSGSLDKRVPSLPSWKIRGVNLGGWLISEPWMLGQQEWVTTMGCPDDTSEFDCVSALGQTRADQAFNDHYARWINATDIQKIHDAGLNTIRIPIGYWSLHSLVDPSEHFPNMDLKYLDAVIEKAAQLGMFVIIDLHGAPGAQKALDPFTGQKLPINFLPGFFTPQNYNRAQQWLTWMTKRIRSNPNYAATVGIIEVLNEPQTDRDPGKMPQQEKDSLTQSYYPQALQAVRDAEGNIPDNQRLHVQFMDAQWEAGNPKSNLPNDANIVFDDHNYVGGAVKAIHPEGPKQGDYMWYTCRTDNRLTDGDTPKIVQEWSLIVGDESTPEFNWKDSQGNPNPLTAPFYQDWFVAQQRLYEKTNGWIFWSWKTMNNDPRWDYSYLLSLKWIPTNAAGLDASANKDTCAKWFPN